MCAFCGSVTLSSAGYKHMVKAEDVLKYMSEALTKAQLLFFIKNGENIHNNFNGSMIIL